MRLNYHEEQQTLELEVVLKCGVNGCSKVGRASLTIE